jgi:hypothetical protein
MNRVTDLMGYLVLDLLYMGLQKLSTENELFQEFLEARLEAHREVPVRKPKSEQTIPF